jgi:predicted transcriptional regulator
LAAEEISNPDSKGQPVADEQNTIDMTVEIVSAFVGNNTVAQSDLPSLISQVHKTLKEISSPVPVVVPVELTPAVPVKKSIHRDYIVCLEDGLKFKSMKRHLRTKYNMTPEAYRMKWSLPADYPMVAEAYAEKRSELAKKIGLGRPKAPVKGRKG